MATSPFLRDRTITNGFAIPQNDPVASTFLKFDTAPAAPKPAAPVTRSNAPLNSSTANATQMDFLGEGLADQGAAPDDPNDAPNPSNPGGISNNEYRKRLRILDETATRTRNMNQLGPDGIPVSGDEYSSIRAKSDQEQIAFNNWLAHQQWNVGGPGFELPFLGDIPGLGPILEGGFAALEGAPLAAGEEIVNHPGRALLTGGLSAGIAAADTAADESLSGVARGIGDAFDVDNLKYADVDVPLTPGQLWEPRHPLIKYSDGDSLNMPGIRDIGEAIGDAGSAIGDAFSDVGDWLGRDNGYQVQRGGGAGGAGGGGALPGAGDGVNPNGIGMGEMTPQDVLDLAFQNRLDQTASNESRDMNKSVFDRLMEEANRDEAPSAAEALLLKSQERAQRNSIGNALAQGGTWRGQAAALSRAQGDAATQMAESGADLAALRAREEQTHRQNVITSLQSAGVLSTNMRAQDIQISTQDAQNLGAAINQAAGLSGTQFANQLQYALGLEDVNYKYEYLRYLASQDPENWEKVLSAGGNILGAVLPFLGGSGGGGGGGGGGGQAPGGGGYGMVATPMAAAPTAVAPAAVAQMPTMQTPTNYAPAGVGGNY